MKTDLFSRKLVFLQLKDENGQFRGETIDSKEGSVKTTNGRPQITITL